MKILIAKRGDTLYRIPEMWLMGASHTRQQDGMPPLLAMQAAINHWIDQKELETLYKEARDLSS